MSDIIRTEINYAGHKHPWATQLELDNIIIVVPHGEGYLQRLFAGVDELKMIKQYREDKKNG